MGFQLKPDAGHGWTGSVAVPVENVHISGTLSHHLQTYPIRRSVYPIVTVCKARERRPRCAAEASVVLRGSYGRRGDVRRFQVGQDLAWAAAAEGSRCGAGGAACGAEGGRRTQSGRSRTKRQPIGAPIAQSLTIASPPPSLLTFDYLRHCLRPSLMVHHRQVRSVSPGANCSRHVF